MRFILKPIAPFKCQLRRVIFKLESNSNPRSRSKREQTGKGPHWCPGLFGYLPLSRARLPGNFREIRKSIEKIEKKIMKIWASEFCDLPVIIFTFC